MSETYEPYENVDGNLRVATITYTDYTYQYLLDWKDKIEDAYLKLTEQYNQDLAMINNLIQIAENMKIDGV